MRYPHCVVDNRKENPGCVSALVNGLSVHVRVESGYGAVAAVSLSRSQIGELQDLFNELDTVRDKG